MCVLSHVWLFAAPWAVACQAPLSMEFSTRVYWSGLPFPPPENLPESGIKPESPASAGRFFTTVPPGKPLVIRKMLVIWIPNNLWRLETVLCQLYLKLVSGEQQDLICVYFEMITAWSPLNIISIPVCVWWGLLKSTLNRCGEKGILHYR